MAKLPDYIDPTDKRAIAEYFIKQRELQEYEKYYLEAINNLEINQIEKLVQDLSLYLKEMK